jgi:hypothetical protein
MLLDRENLRFEGQVLMTRLVGVDLDHINHRSVGKSTTPKRERKRERERPYNDPKYPTSPEAANLRISFSSITLS